MLSEQEEKTLRGVVDIAQTLLSGEPDRAAITPGIIAKHVATAAMVVPQGAAQAQAATLELIRRFSQWIGKDTVLVAEEDHCRWLNAARKKDARYWPRYQTLLEKKMPPTVVDALNESTDTTLGLLEDPTREGAWSRRGLVVGHVQSGKTSHYAGLICKAADAGYKVIIVLAGLHNNLRSQTQIRLEEAFLGYQTPITADRVRVTGVGDIDSDQQIRPNCATSRNNTGDFTAGVAKNLAISPEQRPWLFVIKKNKTVLDRLLRWIRNHVTDSTDAETKRRVVSNLPLLMIDDEADHASVDTGEQVFDEDGLPDEEHQPTAINSRIRQILHAFSKSAYVGYTATPFANIFIHRRNETPNEGPDLFPQSFILSLSAPSNYVGPTQLLALRGALPKGGAADSAGDSPLLMRPVTDHTDASETGGWMPPKHGTTHSPPSPLPATLTEAIQAFVLACAVRQIREQGRGHTSMLIHVTRYTLVQGRVQAQVTEEVKKMRQRLSRGVANEALLAVLQHLWETDFVPTTHALNQQVAVHDKPEPLPSWAEIEAVLPEVLADIEVKAINGSAKDALDYNEAASGQGLKVIAIGGDKLARGLTLEGLCVSYFLRSSKMYDTLMQMGRWFGYRPGYLDLCRLYTTHELMAWFGHIAEASEELRTTFDVMAASGATPREYGLRVQSHPTLMITSPLKMRTAKPIRLSFSGEVVETSAFYKDPRILQRNMQATEALMAEMGTPTETNPVRVRGEARHESRGTLLWSGVPAHMVESFFRGYTTHDKAKKAHSPSLAEFVAKMAKAKELTTWTVVLLGSGTGAHYTFAGGQQCQMPKRAAEATVKDRYSVGRLLSPRDEAIDLTEPEWLDALSLTQKLWQPDPARQADNHTEPTAPTQPSGALIRKTRNKMAGLLLLYPLDPADAGLADLSAPIMGFVASFPASRSDVTVDYRVDHLVWEQEYGAAD